MNRRAHGESAKISKISVVDQVCEAIKRDIIDGTWSAGEKLPSEAELAEHFGVNRLSVRMALQKLNTLGLTETRVGEGSFVRKFSLGPFLEEISPMYASEQSYQEVQQLRNILESACIAIAIRSGTQEEKEQLRMALDNYLTQLERCHQHLEDEEELEKLVDNDFSFHYAIVRMSHNRLYKDIYYMVQQLVRQHIRQRLGIRLRQQGWEIAKDYDDHKKLYQAIVSGNMAYADEVIRTMLGVALEDVQPAES